MKKRVCFVAGFDANGKIADYVVYLIKSLSQLAEVYYCGDFNADPAELDKLNHFCVKAFAKRHGKYDFGSWQELIRYVGSKKLATYDELILINDSCYGPLFDLAPLFEEMEGRNTDFWGLTAAYQNHLHIQSYFLAFKKPVLQSDIFYQFFDTVRPEKNFHAVCSNYEDRLTFVLSKAGFTYDTFIPYGDLASHPYTDAMNAITNRHFPFLKVKFFTGGIRDQGPTTNWRGALQGVSNYPLSLIEQNLQDRGYDLATIDQDVRKRRPEANSPKSASPKALLRRAAKFALHPILEQLDARIDNRNSSQLNVLKKRYNELIEQLDLPTNNSVYTISSPGSDLSISLDTVNALRIEHSSPKFILTKESEILTIGRFGEYDLSALEFDDSRVLSLNNDWLDSNQNTYQTKHLDTFYFSTHSHPRILFDLIISQPLCKDITSREISAFIDNLKSSMHRASVLVLAAPNKQQKIYAKLLAAAGLHPARSEHGLVIAGDPFQIYCAKIKCIKGYKPLIYKLK